MGSPVNLDVERQIITDSLNAAKQPDTDSPLYQLLEGFAPPDIGHLKTDVFREQVDYSNELKERIAAAGQLGVEALKEIQGSMDLSSQSADFSPLVDLLLSYRELAAWQEMADLVSVMPKMLTNTIFVTEQHALALNRLGKGADAEKLLLGLLESHPLSTETSGIHGRIYKDRWQKSRSEGETIPARGHLKKAIDTYLKGFQSDWRDAYPGVNAVTLMELAETKDDRQAEILPVVRYSANQSIRNGTPDYWDYATVLELAVLAHDEVVAMTAVADAVAQNPSSWQAESTLNNLHMIKDVREERGEKIDSWLTVVERALGSVISG